MPTGPKGEKRPADVIGSLRQMFFNFLRGASHSPELRGKEWSRTAT
jgi:hypothetical protein